MDKKFEKYFGKNIIRIIYVIGVALCFLGVFNLILGNPFFGAIFVTVGVITFFLTSHKQASDKDIDALLSKAQEVYCKNKIEGQVFEKATLDPSQFSVFGGFIRDSGDVRFKAGRDQKIRTSRFFVTALSTEKNDCKIFTTVYDIISGETVFDERLFTKGADKVEFSKEKIEFPRGIYKCTVKTERNGETNELSFYLPDDALADKLTEKIK
jgi:hypothetical protein